MTAIEIERSDRGRRCYAEVMTFDPPEGRSPAAVADAEQPLRDHVYAALNSGDLTIIEMRETVLHFAVYCGWPKASRFNLVVDEQWERIHRERGESVPPPDPLLPLVTPSDPEQRLLVGEQSFRDVYAALKSRDVSFDEMDELALHFAAYYGWAKAAHLSDVITEQKQRVLNEWATESQEPDDRG